MKPATGVCILLYKPSEGVSIRHAKFHIIDGGIDKAFPLQNPFV